MRSSLIKPRIAACAKSIKKAKLNGLLISHPANITYLTGFREASGYLLITSAQELTFITNALYQAEAEQIRIWKVKISRGDIFALVGETIKQQHLSHVGFEGRHLPQLEYQKIKDLLSPAAVDFSPTKTLVEDIRAIKSPWELTCIRQAVQITEKAVEFIKKTVRPDMSEKELHIEIDRFLRLQGDNSLAFTTIVAAGQNSAFPHHLSGQTTLNKKIFLTDLGAKNCDYCADLTRLFFWSTMPARFRRIYDLVQQAQDAAIKKIRPGIKCGEVDKAARQVFTKKGYAKRFLHGTGHGVGLQVHEEPYLQPGNATILKEGMVVTVEPALYLPGNFGIRIEDLVAVTAGKAEILSKNTHKKQQIIG